MSISVDSKAPPTLLLRVREVLFHDAPTIDTALKNYASWMMAQTATRFSDWNSSEILTATRVLSKTINGHVPVANTEVVSQVWKEAAAGQSKVTKVLGRSSLRAVWKELDVSSPLTNAVGNEKATAYVTTFERFLFSPRTDEASTTTATSSSKQENSNNSNDDEDEDWLLDARLIWDADGGKHELARRAAVRNEQAAQRRKEEDDSLPRIEEIPSGEKDDDDDDDDE